MIYIFNNFEAYSPHFKLKKYMNKYFFSIYLVYIYSTLPEENTVLISQLTYSYTNIYVYNPLR